jgi:outer membrane lipoprotein-sorting protein
MQLVLVSACCDRFLRQNRHFPFDMQRLPRLTKAILFVAIAFGALQLWNVAKGWQGPPAKAAPAEKIPQSAEAPEPNPDAVALVRAARERLLKWQSIQANVVQTVDIGDRRFKASGRFMAGELLRLRLEYELSVGNTVGKLLEVCDGQVLHVERRIEEAAPSQAPAQRSDEEPESREAEKPVIEATRRDVQRILRATGDAEGVAVSMHAADIGLGGLSALLASLERAMIFDSIREEEHDGQKFRVVQGVWKPAYLADLQTKLGGMAPQLAVFLPERVRIYFEAESLFPVRILYLKLASQERRSYRAMLSLEFHDVEFDVMLPADAFTYRVPPGVQQKDDTDDFIQLLKASQGPPALPAEATAPNGESPLNLKRSTEPMKP